MGYPYNNESAGLEPKPLKQKPRVSPKKAFGHTYSVARWTCPECEAVFDAGLEDDGQKVKCDNCEGIFILELEG